MPIIHLRRGDDFEAEVDCTAEGQPKDMTGWLLEAVANMEICEQEVETTTDWIDQTMGLARISIAHEVTQSMPLGDYELQVRATSPSGKRSSSLPVTLRVRE